MKFVETPPPREFGPFAAGVALVGSPREMGRTLGRSLARRPDWHEFISPMTAYWAHSLQRFDPFLGDSGMERLEGANSVGLDARSFAALQFEHVFAVQTRYHFAYRSSDGKLVHGVGLEGSSQPRLQSCHPNEGARHVLVAEPGQIGGLQGMNEHGITVSVAILQNPLRQIRGGRLPAVLVLQILSSATCLADVLALFRETKPCCALGLLATSSEEDRISYTEWDGQTLATMARPPWLIAANSPLMRGDVVGRSPQSMEAVEFLKSHLTNEEALPNPEQLWDTLNTLRSAFHNSLWEPGRPGLKHSRLDEATTNPIGSHLGDASHRTKPPTREPILVPQVSQFPLLDPERIQRQPEHIGLEVELDPTRDVFLREHRFAGQPVLPGVLMMELAAQAGCFDQPELQNSICLENIEFLDRLQFPMDLSRTAEIRLRPTAAGQTAELYSDFRNAKGKRLLEEKLYFRASLPGVSPPKPTLSIPSPVHDWFNIWYYDEGLVIYHGEVFRRLQQMQVAGDEAWGKILAPHASDVAPHRGAMGWQLPSAVMDACFFVCGSFTWFKFPGLVAIPHRIRELTCWSAPEPEESCLAYVRFREREEKHCHFDIVVVGEEGRLLFRMEDFCNRIVSAPPSRSKATKTSSPKSQSVTESRTLSAGQVP